MQMELNPTSNGIANSGAYNELYASNFSLIKQKRQFTEACHVRARTYLFIQCRIKNYKHANWFTRLFRSSILSNKIKKQKSAAQSTNINKYIDILVIDLQFQYSVALHVLYRTFIYEPLPSTWRDEWSGNAKKCALRARIFWWVHLLENPFGNLKCSPKL